MSRPLVIAHRGASAELPESTLPAFERAIELGADFVELDVQPRPDGALVVSHDPPVPGSRPASLPEVLDLCRGRIGVMAELKSPYRHRRHRLVARTLALLDPDDVLVCFEPGALEEARRLRPGLRRLHHAGAIPPRAASARGCWGVGFADRRVTAAGLGVASRLGLETFVYTVNDPARMRELAELGVGGIFTDDPRRALAALRAPRSG